MNNIVTGAFPSPDEPHPCEPFEAAMRLLERRWAGAVVRALLEGALRFSEIRERLPGVTDAVLSGRLRELCAWGLAIRTAPRPGEVRYELTDIGQDLAPVVHGIEDFGTRHRQMLQQIPATRRA